MSVIERLNEIDCQGGHIDYRNVDVINDLITKIERLNKIAGALNNAPVTEILVDVIIRNDEGGKNSIGVFDVPDELDFRDFIRQFCIKFIVQHRKELTELGLKF